MPTLPTITAMMDGVMNELRIPVSNLTERTKIQLQMSYVYGDICAKQDWWWLQRRHVINTVPLTNNGTVALTENSTTITFSAAPVDSVLLTSVSLAGYVLVVSTSVTDSDAVFLIESHTSGATTATLDKAYTGATETAATYNAYKVRYTLPANCGKLLGVKRYGYREPIRRIGIEDLSYLQQTGRGVGKPQVYSIFDFETEDDPSTQRLLQIHPYPDKRYRLEIWYKVAQAGDLSDLSLPVDYQQVLNYGTLSRCYPIFLNDLERGQYYLSLFNDMMFLMSGQQREYAGDHPGIDPAAILYRNARQGRRRWPGSLGTLFDTYPNVP